MAFVAVYAARLGATGFQISLLSAGPAVVNLLFSLPAGKWLTGHTLTQVSFQTAGLTRLGYLFLIPLPLLLPSTIQIWIIILITLVMAIPGTVLSIAFNSVLAELIPPEDRATVIGRRNALTSLTMTLTALSSGQILDLLDYPVNYVIVFGLGTLGSIYSTYHLQKLKTPASPPPTSPQPLGDLARPGQLRIVDSLRLPAGLRFLTRVPKPIYFRLDILRGPYGGFLAAYLFFYSCQYVPAAISPLYMVNNQDSQI